MNQGNFFSELKRRNVYKVAVAYAVIAWLLIQGTSILFPTFEAPAWVMKVFVVVLAAGFVVALFIAWAFEMTPQGMKRTEDIRPDEGGQAEGSVCDSRCSLDTSSTFPDVQIHRLPPCTFLSEVRIIRQLGERGWKVACVTSHRHGFRTKGMIAAAGAVR